MSNRNIQQLHIKQRTICLVSTCVALSPCSFVPFRPGGGPQAICRGWIGWRGHRWRCLHMCGCVSARVSVYCCSLSSSALPLTLNKGQKHGVLHEGKSIILRLLTLLEHASVWLLCLILCASDAVVPPLAAGHLHASFIRTYLSIPMLAFMQRRGLHAWPGSTAHHMAT